MGSSYLLYTCTAKKENNEPATHQFFGGAMRARLAPETRATLAGTKTRAAQAQRSGILVPEGTEIIDIVTTYLPVVQSFKKGNIAAATRVPAHPPVPANPGFTRWCPPCKNRYSWLHIEPFRAGFSTDGVVGASWVGFCKKNPIFSYFFSIFPPHFILKKVVHLIVIYLYTRAPNIYRGGPGMPGEFFVGGCRVAEGGKWGSLFPRLQRILAFFDAAG